MNMKNSVTLFPRLFGILLLVLLIIGSSDGLSCQSRQKRAFLHFRNGLLYSKEGKYDEAVSELKKAAELDTSAVIMKALGDVYVFNLNRYDLGAPVYEKYLDKNPYNNRIINIVLQIYMSFNRLSRAENVLTMVINRGNNRPEYYDKLVDLYLQEKKLEDAQNTAILYLERMGESDQSCQRIAEYFIKNSMVIEGLEFFDSYLKNHPSANNVNVITGLLNEAQKDLDAALRSYHKMLEKDETASFARGRLAGIYIAAERYDDALQLYDGIDYDDPTEIQVKLQICQNLLGSENPPFQRVEKIMLSVKDKFGAESPVYYILGFAQMQLSRDSDAEQNFFTATKLNPSDFLSFFYLSNVQYNQEKFEESLRSIIRAVELRPDIKDFYVLKGLLYNRLENTEKAIETYEAGLAIKSDPNNAEPTLLNNYAYLLAENNMNLEKALEMAKKAVLSDQENRSFLDTIGWVYFKLGNVEDAMRYIEKSLQIDPNDPEVLDHLGDIFEKMGKIDSAIANWQRALQNDSENEKIKEKLRKYNVKK